MEGERSRGREVKSEGVGAGKSEHISHMQLCMAKIALLPGHSHLQYLIAYSMQIRRGKAWDIWLCVVMSGGQRIGTWERCQTVTIPVLCQTVPGIMNDEWY